MAPGILSSKAPAPAKPAPSNPQDDIQRAQQHDLVLKTFRLLISDLCQQFNGGHPGGAIGMAAIGIALWKYVMSYAPLQPNFFNRDRFVLSNGHTCLFQYAFLHLTGYRAMTMDQLKSYHSSRWDSICPGHPEIEIEGIEVTTGPLGQGVANAVGLAMATKNLAATYNRPGYDVVSNHTWCMIGDACLQEGVALEAISFAGHLKLNNLTVIYDNNQITCDGSVDLTNTEDVNAKMRACGWDVIDVEDGCHDVDGIVAALKRAKSSTDKPTFINVRTIIGLDSAVAGQAEAHGAAFGADDVKRMKRAYGFNEDEYFVVGDQVRQFFSEIPSRGEEIVSRWNDLVERYAVAHPLLAEEFQRRLDGKLPSDWKSLLPRPEDLSDKPLATRASSGLMINPLAKEIKLFMVGTADLSPSVHMAWEGKEDFQHVSELLPIQVLLLSVPLINRTSTAQPPHYLWHQRLLHRPIYSLRCPRTRHVCHLQRHSGLFSRDLHPHHELLLHVLPLRSTGRSNGCPPAPQGDSRSNPRHNRDGRRRAYSSAR